MLLGRVLLLQTFQRDGYFAASVDQRTRVNILRAARGVIFDRNGNELALSVPSTTVYADPRDITDIPGVAHALSVALAHTPEQESRLLAALSKPGSKFSYIARGLSKENAQTLLGLGLPGVYSYNEPSRQVEGGVAGAVIGRTDPDGLGTSGLEKQFNEILTGVDGKGIREVDMNGRSIAGVQTTAAAPIPGDDIVLTLDKNIQFQTDRALLDRVGQLSAKGGTAIVMNTKTGQVYAMSNVRRNAAGSVELASGNFAAVERYTHNKHRIIQELANITDEEIHADYSVLIQRRKEPNVVNSSSGRCCECRAPLQLRHSQNIAALNDGRVMHELCWRKTANLSS